LVPAKVIHALNLNTDDLNAANQQRFSSAFGVDYGKWVLRKAFWYCLEFLIGVYG